MQSQKPSQVPLATPGSSCQRQPGFGPQGSISVTQGDRGTVASVLKGPVALYTTPVSLQP